MDGLTGKNTVKVGFKSKYTLDKTGDCKRLGLQKEIILDYWKKEIKEKGAGGS